MCKWNLRRITTNCISLGEKTNLKPAMSNAESCHVACEIDELEHANRPNCFV